MCERALVAPCRVARASDRVLAAGVFRDVLFSDDLHGNRKMIPAVTARAVGLGAGTMMGSTDRGMSLETLMGTWMGPTGPHAAGLRVPARAVQTTLQRHPDSYMRRVRMCVTSLISRS